MKIAVEPKRIYEPIALGVVANVLATYLLKPLHPQFEWSDFMVACILMAPITEFNRYMDSLLEKRYPWALRPLKRILYHCLYLTLTLIVSLNILGNLYILITGQSFFSWRELLLINGITFLVSLLLTFFNWTVHFYIQWKSTSLKLQDSSLILQNLQQDLCKADHTAEFQKGNQKIRIELRSIRVVKIESGVVRVFVEDGQGSVFPGTLRDLAALLPGHLFFAVTRDVIIHRNTIQSISSSSYGKIDITAKLTASTTHLTISRLKAAAFRKWYYSTSI